MNAAGIDVEPALLNMKRNGEALEDGKKVWGNDEIFAGQKSEFNSKARYIYERG